MNNAIVFQDMIERAMQMNGRSRMRPVIEKELLHYDILFALDQENILDQLVFQGGTALRLCYGGLRFSEDLDFTGGKNFSNSQLGNMKKCLEQYLGGRYGLAVSVKEPKEFSDNEIENVRVDKWQLGITTAPEHKDIPKQKIKIEVINVPSYSKEPRALQRNYDFLPDGYGDLLVMTESLDELMADKLISFVNCTKMIRYRDIWDLRWLKQQGAAINTIYIKNKINDYHIQNYAEKLKNRLKHLDEIIKAKAFLIEMTRFIPTDVLDRTIKKEKFLNFLVNEIRALLIAVWS